MKEYPYSVSYDAASEAIDEWGFNCGPAAICAISDMSPSELRPYLQDFEKKGYTNITMMRSILMSLGWRWAESKDISLPEFGLVRVQWNGPWCEEGQHWANRQRHTHWIAARRCGENHIIFDVNAVHVGGWTTLEGWRDLLVPWLLGQCEPKAYGDYSFTHVLDMNRRVITRPHATTTGGRE